MIEVTCGACGSTHRFAEADVPPGGKAVTCAQCKARITIPARAAPPRLPAMPAIPTPMAAPKPAGGKGDVIDLGDLPAPKRPSPLAGAKPAAGRAPTPPPSPLAGAKPAGPLAGAKPAAELDMDLIDLPGPGPGGGLELADLGELSDLPAPVGPTSRNNVADLPAPVGPTSRNNVADLPAPVGPTSRNNVADLPAPVGPTSRNNVADLPAPVGPTSRNNVADLPAPVGPTSRNNVADLPAPVGPTSRNNAPDLPAPKRASTSPGVRSGSLEPRTHAELPAAARPGGPVARPGDEIELGTLDLGLGGAGGSLASDTPGGLELDDLPPPVAAPAPPRTRTSAGEPLSLDLPGAGGFFDDLPPPKGGTAGALDDELLQPVGPSPSADLPAPKGFFDDLPAPKAASTPADLPAPKGFFDDLPGPVGASSKRADAAPPAKGFFDDLPGPAPAAPARGGKPTTTPPPAGGDDGGRPRGLDLDDLDLAPPTLPPTSSTPRAAVASAGTAPKAVPLELPTGPDVPPLELDGPGGDRFGGLELPAVAPAGTAPAKAAAAAAAAAASAAGVSFKAGGGDAGGFAPPPRADDLLDLDVEGKPGAPGKSPAKAAAAARAAAKAPVEAKPRLSARGKRIALVAVLGVVALGAGGFWFYQRSQAQQEHAAKIGASLAAARAQLAAGEPGHWQRAAASAQQVLAVSPRHPEALGIAVEATLAALFEDGVQPQQRRATAEKLVEAMHGAAVRGKHAERGSALWSLASGDPEGAVKALTELVEASPDDADLQLFLGWAQAARRDYAGAAAAFTAAAKDKRRELAASYGLGMVQLETGDLDGARHSFGQVNKLSKKPHLGAQIGVAAAMPPAEYARREAELLSILEQKEAAQADPRAVAMGWRLAGDDARRAGRLDAARDRYRKALKLTPDDVLAIVGDAELDILERRFDTADASLARALTLAPKSPTAALARAQLDLARDRHADAEAALAPLVEDKTLGAADRARALLLHARALEALGKLADAEAAYARAQDALGTADISPTLARVALLGKLADAAQAASNADDAAAKRKLRGELLAGLEAQAGQDPANALALGRAYRASGDGAAAERWLRAALAARPTDVEIHVQLGGALELQGKRAEAIEVLRAAYKLEPSRDGVGTRLAEALEAAGRVDDAKTLWKELLAQPDVTLDLRLRAGLYLVRNGDPAAGAKQGDLVLTAEPRNTTALYLKAEGLYAARKYEEARDVFKTAADLDAQAIYLDGYARSSEMLAYSQGDARYDDDALRGYTQAAEAAPKMISAQLGRARIHLKRREYDRAIEAYKLAGDVEPGHPDLAYGLGMAYAGKGDRARAVEQLSRAVKQPAPRIGDPDDPDALVKAERLAGAHLALAQLYLDDDQPRPAIGHYAAATRLGREAERAGKVVTWMEDALWQLGELEKEFGSEREACKALLEYLGRSPKNPKKVDAVDRWTRIRCRG